MAIISILAAALGIVLSKVRSRAMVKRAESDIHGLCAALDLYKTDIGFYPVAPFALTTVFADDVLYWALVDKNTGGYNRGWGKATDQWDFLTDNSRAKGHVLDPWGVPYYYIANPDYLRGVRIRDDLEAPATPGDPNLWPKIYGTTPVANDYSAKKTEPPSSYYGPAPDLDAFYSPTTYQIHSKGPDQKTDTDDGDTTIDPCDRGTDRDDLKSW